MIETKIPVECYSRISGYFRPIMQWNKGKRSEFSERKYLNLDFIGRQMTKRKCPENGEVNS